MNFLVNTFLWTNAFSEGHLPLLEKFKHWNADGVEFAASRLDDFPLATVRRELERLSLMCTVCVSPPTVEQSLIHDDPAARKAAARYLRAAVELAAGLGARILAGPVYAHVAWFTGARPTEEQFAWAVEGLQELVPDLDAAGVDLAIEPMNRFESFFLPTAADGVRLCEAIGHPRVGLMLDTAHMVIEEKDPLEALYTAGHWLKHMQTPESDRGTPGSGRLIDWPELFRVLTAIGYRGGCSIESFAFQEPKVAAKTWCWRDLAASPDALARDGLSFLRSTHAAAMS